MNFFNIDTLSNGIRVITKQRPNTPRTAVNLYMGSGAKHENLSGTANLAGRLLLQGTKSRTSEQIANELDSNAIELGVEVKQDYLRTRTLFLNEDLNTAIDLMEDVVKNPTFENIDRERMKFAGEIQLELDSPKTRAFDRLICTIFKNHPYGHSHTRILENLPSVKKEDVIEYYRRTSLIPESMMFAVVGDVNRQQILDILEEKFGSIPQRKAPEINIAPVTIPETQTVTLASDDAAQAQIIQGWMGPSVSNRDYPAVVLLNTILGSSGLSSRLFVELRDKKGLAYHVRSSVESLKQMGLITVYIGTSPNNIQTCLEGFEIEINKLKNEIISEKELNDAKNNYLGKRAFLHETNAQQAYYLGYFDIMGLGPEFDTVIEKAVKKTTAEDIKRVANIYFSAGSVISILAEEEFLACVK